MGPRARRTSLVCSTTIIPSHTVVQNSIKLDRCGLWGVQSRHICQRSRSCVPSTTKYLKVRYSWLLYYISGYLGPRARRTPPACAKTIIPSHTLVHNSIKLDIGSPWGVQSRHIGQRSRSCVPSITKYLKVPYTWLLYKISGYLGLRARRTSPVRATTITPSHTVVCNSIKLDIGGPWGVQSRHKCPGIRIMCP